VDIVARTICRTDIQGAYVETWNVPSEPGCIAPMLGGGLAMALRSGVYVAKTWQGDLQHVVTLPYDAVTVRANDGKCDALGRFWIGTVDETKKHDAAALYCVDCTGAEPRVTCHLSNATTANGLAWSPDQQTMYWADTPQHEVLQWDYDLATATMRHERKFLHWTAKPEGYKPLEAGYGGRPDGATTDSMGNYYVAMYEGGCVEQYTSQGERVARYETPVPCPTMPCFGGEDFRTLFITTARHGRSESELRQFPHAGCIFWKKMQTPGLPVNCFTWEK